MATLTVFEQSAFTFEYDGHCVAVDVGSLTSPTSLAAIGQPVASIVSHKHFDHFNEVTIEAFGCPVYTVEEVRALAHHSENYQCVKAGESITIPGTQIQAHFGASDHGPNVGLVQQVSCVLEAGESAVAFAADMYVPTPLPHLPYSTLLIPIGNNGYTFDAVSAAEYVKSIGFTGTVIPIHFQNFENSEQMLAEFTQAIGKQARVVSLKPGERIEV